MVANETPGEPAEPPGRRVFISYKRDAPADRTLAVFLRDSLERHGHSVYLDLEIPPGADWSSWISSKIRNSDAFIVLLSEASAADHGFVLAETVMANESYGGSGHPKIIPVRVAFTKNLPLRLNAALGHLQHFDWRDQFDNDVILPAVLEAIGVPSDASAAVSFLERGEHFIVTASLWKLAGARPSIAGTAIVPVVAGEEASLAVTRAKGPGFFGVRVLDGGALEVAIWKGAAYRTVHSEPGQFVSMLEGDTHGWCFTQHPPAGAVLLARPDGRKDRVVITFDTECARAVWQISHQRNSHLEHFLIVMKDSSAR